MSLSKRIEERKKQIREHIELFGQGKNRDIDQREKFVFQATIPIIEKDIKEFIQKLKDEFCKCISENDFKCKYCFIIDKEAGVDLI